jgi:hypothetical protein
VKATRDDYRAFFDYLDCPESKTTETGCSHEDAVVLSQFSDFSVPSRISTIRRRSISPQAGKALSILGHAIEYLSDEFIHDYDGVTQVGMSAQIRAIQILMAANRQVYFECPEMPTVMERIRRVLHGIR